MKISPTLIDPDPTVTLGAFLATMQARHPLGSCSAHYLRHCGTAQLDQPLAKSVVQEIVNAMTKSKPGDLIIFRSLYSRVRPFRHLVEAQLHETTQIFHNIADIFNEMYHQYNSIMGICGPLLRMCSLLNARTDLAVRPTHADFTFFDFHIF